MKRFVWVALWMCMVFVAVRLLPNWQAKTPYADLLPQSALQVLAQQPPLQIDVFALPHSPVASLVENFLEPLVNSLPQVEVNYINASQSPDLVQRYQISKQGEMIVRQGEAEFQLSTLSYEAFFNGLKKMNLPADRWVVFLEDLGGRSFYPGQAGSYHQWITALKAANYPVTILPWQAGLSLPKQTRLLILASPSISLTVEQMLWLEDQIKTGISVLWLMDPQTMVLQPELSLLFDVMRTSDQHLGQLIVKAYPEHEINQQFDRPLDLLDVMPFETAGRLLWQNEQQQTIAATQEVGNSRLLVVGDSDFLSGELLNSGGNLEMSFRLLDWLLKHEKRIDLPSIGLGQTQLFYSRFEILLFAGIMLLLIPLTFLIVGFYQWRKSRSV